MNPRVSVIMAVWNSERYLADSIESILNQTFEDFEYIIIDDGSFDASRDIIARYAVNDQRIKPLYYEHQGLTRSLNRGIREARGAYIARMDADDISLPERLEKEHAYLMQHPDIAVVSCFAYVIDDCGRTVGTHCPPLSTEDIRKRSFFSGQICHPSVMFRADVVRMLGGYNEAFRYAQDYELWLRLMQKHAVATIPEFLFSWRKSAQGIGRMQYRDQRRYAQQARIAAIRNGLYPSYYYMLLFIPYIQDYIPAFLKQWLKRLL